ncbi:MAG: hypothetical protein Q4F13_02105 [Pseudomonadota bacterium]|nr:hypothetical protein [Pseudomonadota bacterium]
MKKTSLIPSSLSYLSLIAICLLLYGQALGFTYVWDDNLLFLMKTDLVNAPLSWDILATPVLPGTSYFRPLVFLTFFIEFHTFGQSAFISHVVNLTFFCVNVLLMYGIGAQLGQHARRERARLLGWLAACIYAVHPANIESTAWISGRFDLMATMFILLSVWLYLRTGAKRWLHCILLGACMMAALLSKELGIVLPAILACVWFSLYFSQHTTWKARISAGIHENGKLLLTLLAVVAVYLSLRYMSMGELNHNTVTYAYLWESLVELRLPLVTLFLYLKTSLLPFSPAGPVQFSTHASDHAITTIQSCAAAIFICLTTWRALRGSLSAWLFMAYLAGLFLVLHVLPIGIANNITQDRFLTAPLAFFVLAVVFAPWKEAADKLQLRLHARQAAGTLTSIGWLVMAALTTLTTVPMWKNELTLWSWAKHRYPDAELPQNNYLFAAISEKKFDLVEEEVKRLTKNGTALTPANQIIYANLLITTGNPDGMNYMKGVMEVTPKFHETNDRTTAGRFLLSPMQISGMYGTYAIGELIFNGDPESALKYNDIALWYLNPGEQMPILYHRIAFYMALGRVDEAKKLKEKLQSIKYYRSDEMMTGVRNMLQVFCDKQKKAGKSTGSACMTLD